eukprot:scaffold725_cov133-Cylindrotheca_fusiformis.AAC.11
MMHSRSATSTDCRHTTSMIRPNSTTATAAPPSSSFFSPPPYFVVFQPSISEGNNDQEKEELQLQTSNAFQLYCFILAILFLFTDTAMTKIVTM